MGRTARILTWSAGIFVGLIALGVGAGYLFVTSDDFRSRVESGASAYSGRKTHIAKISIDWGSTAHVHLDGVEVANADWGKADHMLKVEQVDFDIRLWPLLKGDFVLPNLVLRKPEVAVEVGDKEQLNWSLGESPGDDRRRQGGSAQGTLPDTADRAARDHRRAPLLPGHQAQALARWHDLDGGGQGRRAAAGRAAAQGQDREPAAHGPLHRRLGPDAARHRAALSDRSQCRLWRHEAHLEGHRAGSLPVDRRQRRSHALRTEPVGDLSLAGHSRTTDAALPHQRQARARARPVEVRQHQVACRRQRSHRRHPDRRDQEARVPHRQAGVAAPGLRRSGASGRRAAGQDRQRLGAAEADPAAARSHRRSVSQRAAPYRAPQGDEHGRHARRQEGRRAGLSAGAGTGLPRPDQQRRGDGQAAHLVAGWRRYHRGRAWRSTPRPTCPRCAQRSRGRTSSSACSSAIRAISTPPRARSRAR